MGFLGNANNTRRTQSGNFVKLSVGPFLVFRIMNRNKIAVLILYIGEYRTILFVWYPTSEFRRHLPVK